MLIKSDMHIRPFEINGKQVTLEERDPDIGVKANFVVKYIESMKCVLSGEAIEYEQETANIEKKSSSRNSVITCTNLLTNDVCKIFVFI
jgi:hypothetical protein